MLVKSFSFLISLEDISNSENNNIDVFVKLESLYTYIVVLVTPKICNI